ncbi:hypothetical protein AX16_002504 [Volvariella volvacea WC 439]|nr:hypothetical protein AX16_002504 [Volvariella volvacea WC 439]
MASKAKKFYEYLMLLMPPIITTAYLAFCWVVGYRTVIVPNSGFVNTSVENITLVKSGVTTISILIIALGLWPIKSLLVDVQGEEFFRVLKKPGNFCDAHGNRSPKELHEAGGISFVTANSMSSVSSLGIIDTIAAILKGQCSLHFVLAFISGFIVLVTSTLAPAALSIQEMLRDSEVMAFEVGAMHPMSLFDPWRIEFIPPKLGGSPFPDLSISFYVARHLEKAGPLTWSEIALNLSSPYTTDLPIPSNSTPQYIVPTPVNLDPDTTARWLTDAFVLRPSCDWETTNLSTAVYNISDIADGTVIPVTIPTLGIDLRLAYSGIPESRYFRMWYYSSDEGARLTMFNSTTHDIALGGHSIWAVGQFYDQRGFEAPDGFPTLYEFDSVGIPSFFALLDDPPVALQFAVLACSPNFSIETVEVLNTRGKLTVTPANASGRPRPFTRQGNLNKAQGEMFFSTLFSRFNVNAGPPLLVQQQSSQIQASLVFGWELIEAWSFLDSTLNQTWTPMPIPNITEMYCRFIRSASKPFLSGVLGTTLVPGIVSEPVLRFAASRPHVFASTALFLALNVLSIMAFFRSGKGDKFNLMRVASVLHESNVTAEMASFVSEKRKAVGDGSLEEELGMAAKGRMLRLVDREGNGVLVIRDGDAS